MTWHWIGPLVLVLSMLSSGASAQPSTSPVVPQLVLGEELAIRGEAREVFGLYTAAGCFLGTAALMGVGGGLGLPMGDTISPPAAITLFTVPLIATIGLSLLTIAVGYDVGLGRWSGARDRSRIDAGVARRDLSTAIAWVYGVGASVMGLSVLSLVPIAVIDGFHTPIYVLPTVAGGLGLLTIVAAAGMDVAAGAWTGFTASVTPLEGGAMLSSSGAF